ncbi:hypothetical protein [Muribaculum intestinale]|uniref:hypothetical protein n=1 Tax=Muribaculum intestinale TaxID=1796646 RepID=UPI0025B7A050|nr:hypothetical protein [Muribaculum intestinale]
MNIFRRFKASLRLREAIKMADKAHQETGKRYYVMPQHGSGGKKLVVMDRYNFRRLKMKHYIHREARVFDLVRECFYCTSYSDGNQFLSPADRKKKVMQYFAWVEADRKATKQRRRNHGK